MGTDIKRRLLLLRKNSLLVMRDKFPNSVEIARMITEIDRQIEALGEDH